LNQVSEKKSEIGSTSSSSKDNVKLPAIAHVICGWPLLLVAIGGAIGGGLGGAAYGLNLAVYKSKLPVPAKVALNLIIGLSAIGIWFAIVTAIKGGRR
jgi:hypothetical protein